MSNRSYIDLKNDINKMESLWQDVANRYDSIPTSLTSSEINPVLKEAIIFSIYNAKNWYSTYTVEKMSSMTANNQSYDLTQVIIDKLSYWNDRVDALTLLIQSISGQESITSFWGYESRYKDWEDNLYEQLRLIDETYGITVDRNRRIYDSLIEIENLNRSISALSERYKVLELPYQVWQTKTTEDIDYSKILVDIRGLSNNNVIMLGEEDFAKAGTISSLKLPPLSEGQYILNIYNKNFIRLTNIISSGGGWYDVTSNKITDLVGWLIDKKYPIFKSMLSDNPRDLKIYLGREIEIKAEMFAFENYINNISFLIDCKLNIENAVYNFFYGQYLDEFVTLLPNGNQIYRRSIKDKNGNTKAVYQIELDFTTKTESGMPVLHYLRTDI